jgi:hypothetical protein
MKTRTWREMHASPWVQAFHLGRIVDSFDDDDAGHPLEPTLRPRYHERLDEAAEQTCDAWLDAQAGTWGL